LPLIAVFILSISVLINQDRNIERMKTAISGNQDRNREKENGNKWQSRQK
jgi:hypothetical protein